MTTFIFKFFDLNDTSQRLSWDQNNLSVKTFSLQSLDFCLSNKHTNKFCCHLCLDELYERYLIAEIIKVIYLHLLRQN